MPPPVDGLKSCLSFIHIPKVPWMVADFLQVLMSKIAGYEAGGSNIEGLIARAFGKGLSVNDIRTSLLILQDSLRIQSSCREPG